MITEVQVVQARKYVVGLRNSRKRAYAGDVMAWMLRWTQKRPEPMMGLGSMAAQAVRLNLAAIIGPGGRDL